jgi:hypothetical protein
MDQNFETVIFPNYLSPDKISAIKSGILKFEEDRDLHIPDITNLTEIQVDPQLKQYWAEIARKVFIDLGTPESAARIPPPEKVKFYILNNLDMIGQIHGGVDNLGRTMGFIVGPQFTEEIAQNPRETEKIYQHELCHAAGKSIVDEPSEKGPVNIKNKGFDKLHDTDQSSGEPRTKSLGVLREPVAELFSFFCSVENKAEVHSLGFLYARETSFLVALLDKMSHANNSSLKSEYSLLLKAFNDLDFNWYKHLINSFEIVYRENGSNPETAKNRSREFARSLNTIAGINGRDEIEIGNGYSRFGHQLSEISRLGEFFETYDTCCGALVDHSGSITIKGISTQLH